MEEIDGGGLFACLIHAAKKKHRNINFLFAVFIIGRTTTTKRNDKRREEMKSVFSLLASHAPSSEGEAHFSGTV